MRTIKQLEIQSRILLSSCLELSNLLCFEKKENKVQIPFERAFDVIMAIQYAVKEYVNDTITEIDEYWYEKNNK